jgi:hypothetical protein
MTPSIRSLTLALGASLLASTPAHAQVSTHRVGFTTEHAGRITGVQVQENRPFTPLRVNLDRITTTNTSTMGQRILDEDFNGFGDRGCIERSSYVGNLDVGSYNAQGGFAEGEIMAAEYVIPASAYPIKIEQINGLFATVGATVSTITEWSVLVWDGPPNTGTLVAEYSSDGLILPHLVMPPGNGGTEIQVSVDPGDPDQIILTNAAGTNSFTVGFRIDEHNNQTQNPCLIPPPQNSNAFPTTDTNGLSSPSNNWLFAIDCGFLGGWNRFSQLGIFQPSGDWGRAVWTATAPSPPRPPAPATTPATAPPARTWSVSSPRRPAASRKPAGASTSPSPTAPSSGASPGARAPTAPPMSASPRAPAASPTARAPTA